MGLVGGRKVHALMPAKGLGVTLILSTMLAVMASSGGADTATSASSDGVDPALLESIASQEPAITDASQLQAAVTLAQATQFWIEQDSVVRSWPRYLDVREAMRQELSQVMHLDRATVAELRDEAAWHRRRFWRDLGYLSPDGYRRPYKARVLLEIARERESANLAISDELVETILTGHPLACFDADGNEQLPNQEVILDLRALRSENYVQVRAEIEQGRAFTFEDFARVADFAALWAGPDPAKAAEAFEWGLAQVGPSLSGSDYEKYAAKVLTMVRNGGGVGFGVYVRLKAKYPGDYLYARRLPSFRGPDPEDHGLTPMLGIGAPAPVAFGS